MIDPLTVQRHADVFTTDVQAPPTAGQSGGHLELAMYLELLESGYDDQKIKVKMKESGNVKQAWLLLAASN